jgi:hypothetical protein
MVRRMTGGRAILHTDELTYSVGLPLTHPLMAGSIVESYRRLSAALLALPLAPAAADDLQIGPTPTSTTPATAGVTGTAYRSPTYGYTLTWDPTWQVQSATSANGEDILVLTNGVSIVVFDAYAGAGGDPATCLTATTQQLRRHAGVSQFALAQGSDGRPLQGNDAAHAYAVYTYTFTATGSNGTPVGYAGYLDCRPLVPGQAVLAIVLMTPLAAFNTQIQLGQTLLAHLTLPTTAPTLTLPTTTPAGGAGGTLPQPTATAGAGAGSGGTLSATDCAGMAAWVAATTQRLDRVDAIGDAYDRAVRALGQGQLDTYLAFFSTEAVEFAQLAAAQRQGPVPPAAKATNEELASAFSTISTSLTQILVTVNNSPVDMYAFNQASKQIELASATLKQDRPRVEQLAVACGVAETSTTQGGTFQPGQTVVVTRDQVIVRDAPATTAGVVESLNRGAVLRVTGLAVPGEGGTWWPVEDPATHLQGYVAAQNLAAAPA